MKKDWVEKTLGEVCNFIGGSQPPKSEFIYDLKGLNKGDYVRLIQIRDYKSDNNIVYIPKSRTKKFCNKDDVMIGRYGPPVFQILKGLEGAYNVALMKAEPKSCELSKEFLFKFLQTPKIQRYIVGLSERAAGQSGVNKRALHNYPIPIPPRPEQKRIVAMLDEAFSDITRAIANAEKNLANARELFESYLENLSFEKQLLGNFVDIRTGKLNANAAVEGGQYPFFTCSREVYAIDNYAFDCEAILLAGNNASGDFNVKHYNGRFNAYQRTYVITIKNDAQLLYRFLYFQLIKSLNELKNTSVGAGTKFLKLGMIKDLMISIPPFEKQQNILNTLEQLSSDTKHLESIYNKKLDALAELKQSILQKVFTGKLTNQQVANI